MPANTAGVQTRYPYALAPQGLSTLLDVEVPLPQERASTYSTQGARTYFRTMSRDNIGWGAPRIHGELQMLGIHVSQATVAKYMLHHPRPPSQTWQSFLNNHATDLVSVDFFTVPTATFQILYAFLVFRVERLIGSIRRECLDHVIIFNERHVKNLLRSYFNYHTARTHLALNKHCPEPRSFELPDQGTVIAIPHVGGLHHEYRRVA